MQTSKTAWRNKKAFLSEKCKEIGENTRMGKARVLFKKIRDTLETVHAKMCTAKDRKSMEPINKNRLRRGGNNT